MGFDIEGARKAGYSDDEIMKGLADEQKFDIDGALKSGYSKQEILDHLTGAAKPETPGFLAESGRQLKKAGQGLFEVFKSISQPKMIATPEGKVEYPEGEPLGLTDIVKGVWEPIKQNIFLDRDATIPQRFANTAVAMAGGDPQRARELQESGDTGGSIAAMSTVPITTALLSRYMRGFKPTAPTRNNVSAGSSLMSKGVRQGFDPQVAAPLSTFPFPKDIDPLTGTSALVQPLVQQAAKDLNITPSSISVREGFTNQADIVGKVKRGGLDVLRVFDRAVEIANTPLETAIIVYGSSPAPHVQQAVYRDLMRQAINYSGIDDSLSRAITGVADDVLARGDTVGGLNALKVHANKEMDSLFRATQGKQIAASAQSSYAYQLAADSIRARLYPEIQRLGGPDLVPYGAREAAAIQARDGVYAKYFGEVAPQQASREAMNYIDYIINGSLYKTHVLRRAADILPTSMGEFNRLFRNYLGKMGSQMTPEEVWLSPPSIRTGFPSVHIEPMQPGKVPIGSIPKRFATATVATEVGKEKEKNKPKK